MRYMAEERYDRYTRDADDSLERERQVRKQGQSFDHRYLSYNRPEACQPLRPSPRKEANHHTSTIDYTRPAGGDLYIRR
jgi:hypothetical protein